MKVRLAYGTDAPEVEVPDDATVVASGEQSVLADPSGAVRASLAHPLAGPALGDLVPRQGEVVVVFPDLTRPMPNTTVLPPLLAELERAGAGPDRVRELRAQTLVITDSTNAEAAARGSRVIQLPDAVEEIYTPIPYIVPAQLFAAHLAAIKGLDADRPRTLQKVTLTM